MVAMNQGRVEQVPHGTHRGKVLLGSDSLLQRADIGSRERSLDAIKLAIPGQGGGGGGRETHTHTHTVSVGLKREGASWHMHVHTMLRCASLASSSAAGSEAKEGAFFRHTGLVRIGCISRWRTRQQQR